MTRIAALLVDGQDDDKPALRNYLAAREIAAINDDAYGAVEGGTDCAAAFTAAFAANQAVYVPNGEWWLTNASAAEPPEGQLIFGAGMGASVLYVQASGGTACAAFSVRHDDLTIRDLTIQLDQGAGSSAHGLQFDAAVENITVDCVEFLGTVDTTGHYPLVLHGSDLTGLYVRRCRFELIEFGILKSNSDTSSTIDTLFQGCRFRACGEGPNFNSPVGTWNDARVTQCHFERITRWAACFASMQRGIFADNTCVDLDAESVHIEDSSHLVITGNSFAGGQRVTSNGHVLIIAGAYAITVANNVFDLVNNSLGSPTESPCGIEMQAGGGVVPYLVAVNNNSFVCRTGGRACKFLGTYGITLNGNLFMNTDVSLKCSAFIDATQSRITGSGNQFVHPAALFVIDDNSYVTMGDLMIDGDFTTGTAFSFLTGNTDSRASCCFKSFTIQRTAIASAAGTVNPLFPRGGMLDGHLSVRFVQNGVTTALALSTKLEYDSGGSPTELPVATGTRTIPGDVTLPATPFTFSGSDLALTLVRAGGTVNGAVAVTFNGNYFP